MYLNEIATLNGKKRKNYALTKKKSLAELTPDVGAYTFTVKINSQRQVNVDYGLFKNHYLNSERNTPEQADRTRRWARSYKKNGFK